MNDSLLRSLNSVLVHKVSQYYIFPPTSVSMCTVKNNRYLYGFFCWQPTFFYRENPQSHSDYIRVHCKKLTITVTVPDTAFPVYPQRQ
jgi:hypothetical protein